MIKNIEHIKWFRLNWIHYDHADELAMAFCRAFYIIEDSNDYDRIPEWVEELAQEYIQRHF